MNVGNGLNVTVPFVFTVYVPSPSTLSSVSEQSAFAVVVVAQSFTDVVVSVAPAPAASPVSTSITWFVSYAPLEVSLSAVGAGGTIGVNVDVAF